ncbi:MAG: hypothetical protein ABSB35_29465 [Bryobacteraceae bacterium]
MVSKQISLLLVYEPATSKGRPMPLARVGDPRLILAVAQRAIDDAISKAGILSEADEVLGEIEGAEVDRLRRILGTLIPELRSRNIRRSAAVTTVM